MDPLVEKLKKEIIEALNLEGVESSDIDKNEPLFGSKLGLDSIDALELIVLLERNYGLKIENADEGKVIFESVDSIANYIKANKAQ